MIWRLALLTLFASLSSVGWAAVVEWNSPLGGSWHEPANWSSNPALPGPLDNVVLRDDGVFQGIAHSTGDDTVKTLSNHDWLTVANSQLTVTGNVTLGSGSRLAVEGPGAAFLGLGSVFITGSAEISAAGGGQVGLPGAKHFAADPRNSAGIWATGAGSLVDLPLLEDFTGRQAHLFAQQGATLNLPQLTFIEEQSGIRAEGAGSRIDLSSLRDYRRSIVEVRAGGEIVFSPEQIENAEIAAIGAQSKLNLAHLTKLDTLKLGAHAGAELSFPLVQRLDGGWFETGGGNSRLDLSTVNTIGPPTFSGWITPSFKAGERSTIDLTGIERLEGAQPWFEARGPAAVIDLSNLTSFVGNGQLRVSGGGAILTPNLTRLEGTFVQVEGVGSRLDLERLTTVDFIGVNAVLGGAMRFPLVTGLNTAPGSRGNHLNADGGTIDLSQATVFRGAQFGHSLAQALRGGRLDLSSVGEVVVGNAEFRAEDAGSVVDLARVARLHNTQDNLRVLAINGGRVQLPSLVSAVGVELRASGSGAVIEVPSLKTLESFKAIAQGGAVFELPAVQQVSGAFQLESSGPGGRLSFPTLNTYAAQQNEPVRLLAQYGGVIELSSVEVFAAATAELRVEGSGSVLDLASTERLSAAQANGLQIYLNQGGRLRTPALSSLTNASIELIHPDTHWETQALAELEDVWVTVQAQAATEFGTAPRLTAKGLWLQVAQPEAKLELPDLEELVGAERSVSLGAIEGGELNLPVLASLRSATIHASQAGSLARIGPLALIDNGTIAAVGGTVRVDAVDLEGRNSALTVNLGTLELPLLESFRDPTHSSSLFAEQGRVELGDHAVAFEGVLLRKFAAAELSAGRIDLETGSRLEGEGPLEAGLANGGVVAALPGRSLTVRGDYAQLPTGILRAEWNEDQAVGELIVEGSAQLEGRLELVLPTGLRPLLGSEHTILRADEIDGMFSSGGSLLDNLTMLTPLVREQAVVVVAALGGDADLNGRVDLTDFGALKLGFGTGSGVAQGDFDGDGAVTLADFAALKQNFGKRGPSFTAPAAIAPQPSSAVLLGLGMALLAMRRRRPAAR